MINIIFTASIKNTFSTSQRPQGSDLQIHHERANGSDNIKYYIKTENKATTDHLQ